MTNQTIYTVGGTVQAGGGIYIPRKADEELLDYCRAGKLAFILSSRQVGKSSLITRTVEKLEEEGVRSLNVDLNELGTNLSSEEWYLGILFKITDGLKLKTNIFEWWKNHDGLGSTQRMITFFRDILLKEVTVPVVLFFDEIDSTLSISFADDFFAALRAVYNARSSTPVFKRLSFVLVGVATPGDLISDSKRTPFNIGYRVDLTDFTFEEALPLAGELDKKVLEWVLVWTGGHPYLTQRLCEYLSKSKMDLTEENVAESVRKLFEGEQGWRDNNIQFVRDMLTKRAPDIQRVLKIYKDIRLGKIVSDDERSIPKAHLKISGVVRREKGRLQPRNRIYEHAFDLFWVKENTPPTTTRKLVFASIFVTFIAVIIAGYFAWQDSRRTPDERADQFKDDFQTAQSSEVRLRNLAGLFELKHDEYNSDARQLFNDLSLQDQLALFAPSPTWGTNKNQFIVVKGLYQSMANTEEDTNLLQAMKESVKEEAPSLAREITAWLVGREELNQKRYITALSNLNVAVGENPENPALYYDRAQANIGLGKDYYSDALNDLQKMVHWDKNRSSFAYNMIQVNNLASYWKKNKNKFEELADAITIPMVLIPAGEFTMGSTPEQVEQAFTNCREQNIDQCLRDRFTPEMPQRQVTLDAYYIDQYEVTNARYAECVEVGVCNAVSSTASYSHDFYYGNIEFDNYPVINVSWFDSNIYCEWRGARLPTEEEWEKAARGTDGLIYPWGNQFDGTKTNFCDINCTLDSVNQNFDDGNEDVSPVKYYESGRSPYGVYDMAGNVWEWTANWYDVYPGGDPSISTDFGQTSRVLRGGSWFNYDYDVRSANRLWFNPSLTVYFLGFRCASDTSP